MLIDLAIDKINLLKQGRLFDISALKGSFNGSTGKGTGVISRRVSRELGSVVVYFYVRIRATQNGLTPLIVNKQLKLSIAYWSKSSKGGFLQRVYIPLYSLINLVFFLL